jgi:ElaB/YqjD/DUF883 family membrane-anchored ribosome-binding protein
VKNLISFVKSRCISQLVVLSASVLFLLINTACSQPSVSANEVKPGEAKVAVKNPPSKVSSPYRQDTNNVPAGQITEFYDAIQPVEGGMNNFSDVDPRQNTSKADAKAEKLIKNASHPEKNKFKNPLDAVNTELNNESIPERVQKFSKDLGKSTQELADGISEESRKGASNLKKNSGSFLDKTQSRVDDLNRKAQDTAVDAGSTVEKVADSFVNKAQQGANDVQRFVQKQNAST